MDMNFCRRCGTKLTNQVAHVFVCENQHTIYANSSPAVTAILRNANDEVLTIRRAIEPGLGELDFPGGFCDGHESAEAALARELAEEVGLLPEHHTTPVLVCTGIDNYQFKGEFIPVLSLVYTATISEDAPITTNDDAENAEFTPLQSLDPQTVYFKSLQDAVILLQRQRGVIT